MEEVRIGGERMGGGGNGVRGSRVAWERRQRERKDGMGKGFERRRRRKEINPNPLD